MVLFVLFFLPFLLSIINRENRLTKDLFFIRLMKLVNQISFDGWWREKSLKTVESLLSSPIASVRSCFNKDFSWAVSFSFTFTFICKVTKEFLFIQENTRAFRRPKKNKWQKNEGNSCSVTECLELLERFRTPWKNYFLKRSKSFQEKEYSLRCHSKIKIDRIS